MLIHHIILRRCFLILKPGRQHTFQIVVQILLLRRRRCLLLQLLLVKHGWLWQNQIVSRGVVQVIGLADCTRVLHVCRGICGGCLRCDADSTGVVVGHRCDWEVRGSLDLVLLLVFNLIYYREETLIEVLLLLFLRGLHRVIHLVMMLIGWRFVSFVQKVGQVVITVVSLLLRCGLQRPDLGGIWIWLLLGHGIFLVLDHLLVEWGCFHATQISPIICGCSWILVVVALDFARVIGLAWQTRCLGRLPRLERIIDHVWLLRRIDYLSTCHNPIRLAAIDIEPAFNLLKDGHFLV